MNDLQPLVDNMQATIIWFACLISLIFGTLISRSFNFWKW
nr:MAG TPA_asm: Particulate methane monooxygenase, B subunit dependent methane monooxygenase, OXIDOREDUCTASE [Inoviridae sp.]